MHDSIHAMNAQTLQSELNDLRELTNCKEGESLRDVVAGLVMDSKRLLEAERDQLRVGLSAIQQAQVVHVCPSKDIVCGDKPANWCATCPKHTTQAAQSEQESELFALKTSLTYWQDRCTSAERKWGDLAQQGAGEAAITLTLGDTGMVRRIVIHNESLKGQHVKLYTAPQAALVVPEGWKFVDNENGSITVSTPAGGSVTLWKTGQGGVESTAYRLAQMLLTATPTPPAQEVK